MPVQQLTTCWTLRQFYDSETDKASDKTCQWKSTTVLQNRGPGFIPHGIPWAKHLLNFPWRFHEILCHVRKNIWKLHRDSNNWIDRQEICQQRWLRRRPLHLCQIWRKSVYRWGFCANGWNITIFYFLNPFTGTFLPVRPSTDFRACCLKRRELNSMRFHGFFMEFFIWSPMESPCKIWHVLRCFPHRLPRCIKPGPTICSFAQSTTINFTYVNI